MISLEDRQRTEAAAATETARLVTGDRLDESEDAPDTRVGTTEEDTPGPFDPLPQPSKADVNPGPLKIGAKQARPYRRDGATDTATDAVGAVQLGRLPLYLGEGSPSEHTLRTAMDSGFAMEAASGHQVAVAYWDRQMPAAEWPMFPTCGRWPGRRKHDCGRPVLLPEDAPEDRQCQSPYVPLGRGGFHGADWGCHGEDRPGGRRPDRMGKGRLPILGHA